MQPAMWTETTETRTTFPAPVRARAPRRTPAAAVALVVASTGVTGALVGSAVTSVAGDRYAPWILGRASGICAYLLMVALVVMGLVLSHPWRTRWRVPSTPARIRVHVGLAVFTLTFLVLHVVVLATDDYARVGWWGALLPMASDYRPVAVTLGVIAAYAGLLAGLTSALAGRWAARVWWPVHKVAGLSLIATWLHGLLAGADSPALVWMYAVTALPVLVLGASRYMARTPSDRIAELADEPAHEPAGEPATGAVR